MTLRDTEVNDLLQAARHKADEMMQDPALRRAINEVATAFASTAPCPDGVTRLSGATAIAICKEEIGNDFRNTNPWADWMAGN